MQSLGNEQFTPRRQLTVLQVAKDLNAGITGIFNFNDVHARSISHTQHRQAQSTYRSKRHTRHTRHDAAGSSSAGASSITKPSSVVW